MNGAKMVRWRVAGIALLGISIVVAVNDWRQPMTQDEREIIRELKKTSGNSFEYDSHGGVEFGGPATTLPRLGPIKSLVRIDVPWNTLCTEFDEKHLECLRGMPNLRRLNFYRHPVSGPALKVLTTLPALEELHCTPTEKVVEALRYIGQCHKLRSLGIGNSNVTDESLVGLAGLANLEVLDLSGSLVCNDLAPLTKLKKLRQLSLERTNLTVNSVKQIGTVRSLEELVLNAITDRGLYYVSFLDRLIFLSFGSSPELSHLGFTHLQRNHQLRELYLSHFGPFTHSQLRGLGALKQVSKMMLDGANVSLSKRRKLEAELPDCEIRWLGLHDRE